MTRLWSLTRWMMRAARGRLAYAAALTALVPLLGLALLGLSGWFIAASAVAGLAGVGLVFDFFRPGGAIRLLSMGRAAGRYGERLIGHDATLRAAEALRLRVFATLAAAPADRIARLHAGQALNRLTADVDAAEGLLIRLVFPLVALALVLAFGAAALWLLAGPGVALAVTLCQGLTTLALIRLGGADLTRAARRREAAGQAIRARAAEAAALRADFLMRGSLPARRDAVLAAIAAADAAAADTDRAERRAAALIQIGPALAMAAALLAARDLGPAIMLMAALVALAQAEALRQFWRGWSERGRIALAARRLTPALAEPAQDRRAPPAPIPGAPPLTARGLVLTRPDGGRPLFAPFDLTLAAGATIGLVAPSGAGKSTLLATLAGLAPPRAGEIRLMGRDPGDWPEPALRERVTLVSQRPALIGGTVAENLALAAPTADPEEMEAALQAVALADVLAPRGGLQTRLGERGAGLSGGEVRRLALARAILRRPLVLLLDEPGEGLDPATAALVLRNIRAALPQTAILIASHRAADLKDVDAVLRPRVTAATGKDGTDVDQGPARAGA